MPDKRKEHNTPIPTMGGLASGAGMAIACLFWFRFTNDTFIIVFFFSAAVLLAVGVMDDMKNMPARYKLVIQASVALLIAFSGVRITSFNGLLGIHDLTISAQYTITVLAITGITNAFNLIDGIDGLAGGTRLYEPGNSRFVSYTLQGQQYSYCCICIKRRFTWIFVLQF